MEAEIKNRIEQICKGQLPDGYVRKWDGVFPTEWKIEKLSPFICEYNEKTTIPNQYPVLTSSRKGLMLQKEYYAKRQVTTENNVGYNVLPMGYITFRSRSDDGRFVFNENNIIERGIISYFYPVFSFSSMVSQEFMIFLLNFSIYKRMYPYIEGTAQQVLSLKKLGQISYALPPIAEQQKIAKILMTQDRVIALREKLLAEKLRQKQYLMQVLLMGKKRLPGYKGKWKTIRFGEVFSFGSTNSFSRQFMVSDGDGIHNIHYGDILTKYGEILDARITKLPVLMKEAGEKIKDFISDGDIVIADTAEDLTAGKVIEVQNVGTQKIAAGMHTMWCTPKRGYFAPGWLGFYMNSMHFHRQLIPYMAGIKVMAISKTNIVKTHLLVPSIDEQCAIVTILTCADREIELLKKGLEQERRKKKALMQLLLSGIVRVRP